MLAWSDRVNHLQRLGRWWSLDVRAYGLPLVQIEPLLNCVALVGVKVSFIYVGLRAHYSGTI